MPPRRGASLGSTVFHGVTARPYRTFATSITAAGQSIWIGPFCTPNEAAHGFDAAAWRLGRGRSELNFPEVESAVEAQFLAPPPLLETRKEWRTHEGAVQRISVTEADDRLMAERLHPEHATREEEFWVQKKQERRAAHMEKRRKKAWIEVEYNNPNT
jgi:hypothetical protein